ncbi:MAG: dihydropteroate synthase, partial [Marinobacter alexandrii]
LPASLAAATIAAMKGASIVRVHDVRETVDAVKVVTAMKEAR